MTLQKQQKAEIERLRVNQTQATTENTIKTQQAQAIAEQQLYIDQQLKQLKTQLQQAQDEQSIQLFNTEQPLIEASLAKLLQNAQHDLETTKEKLLTKHHQAVAQQVTLSKQ